MIRRASTYLLVATFGLAPASGLCARARAMASVTVSGVWATAGAANPNVATRRQVEAGRIISLTKIHETGNRDKDGG